MFGNNLKMYRRRKGFSQSELADKLFVTRQCVSKWEKGVTEPDLETLNKISGLLGVSIDVLIKDDCLDVPDKHETDINRILLIVNILVALFCAFAFVSLWRFLPPRIPAHWTNGVVDRYGSNYEVLLHLVTVAVFLIVDLIVFFVMKNVSNKPLIICTHLPIVLQFAYFIFAVVTYASCITSVLPFVTCLSASLVLCVSIAMHPKIVRQNQWLGVRTRETLRDKTVWNKTNALACYLFAAFSFIIWIVGLLVVSVWSCLGLFAYIVPTAIVIIYSKSIAKKVKEKE